MTLIPLAAAPAAAVVICDGEMGAHIGIAYRAKKSKQHRVLHLAWHFKLKDEDVTDAGFARMKPLAVKPSLDETELQMLAMLCVKRAKFGPQDIPYAFKFEQSTFDPTTGGFIPGPGERGLTCSTFVLAMCAWAGIKLVDVASWETRPQDTAFFETLLKKLREQPDVSPQHIQALEVEKGGSLRCRAEEVAVSTGFSRAERPLPFAKAAPAGQALSDEYYATAFA